MCFSTARTSSQVRPRDMTASPISLRLGSYSLLTASSQRPLSSACSHHEVSAPYSYPAREKLDPKSAAQKIIRILSQKVEHGKKVEEFKKSIFAQRIKRAPEKPVFTVEKIPVADYPAFKRTITSWMDEIGMLKSQKGITETDRARLSNSEGILSMIESELIPGGEEYSRSRGKPNPTFFLVAKNPVTENIEAIACVIEPHQPVGSLFKADYEINYLATAPKNLRLYFQTTRITGAATALIENIGYRTLRHTSQKRISLYSSPNANDFYKNLGFTIPKGECKFSLSGEKLIEFLSRFGGIFLGSSIDY